MVTDDPFNVDNDMKSKTNFVSVHHRLKCGFTIIPPCVNNCRCFKKDMLSLNLWHTENDVEIELMEAETVCPDKVRLCDIQINQDDYSTSKLCWRHDTARKES